MGTLSNPAPPVEEGWRRRCYDVVFGHHSPAGRNFDILLIIAIVASVLIAIIDSVASMHEAHSRAFLHIEWTFTVLFTLEYLLRLMIVRKPLRYAGSFFGVIDLLAVLPTYLSLLVPGAQYLLVIRVLRIVRVFRILKLIRYVDESAILLGALARSRRKIFVFLLSILTIVVIFGSVMFVVEGPANGFTSIPMGMYWAIVTVATVGYGDVAPGTPAGRVIASILMLIGYGIIAVPTGIYTAELATGLRQERDARVCGQCGRVGHETDAAFCRGCGSALDARAGVTSGDGGGEDAG